METVTIAAGVFMLNAFIGAGRVLWYALSGEYEIDQRLNSIGK